MLSVRAADADRAPGRLLGVRHLLLMHSGSSSAFLDTRRRGRLRLLILRGDSGVVAVAGTLDVYPVDPCRRVMEQRGALGNRVAL